MNEPYLGYIPCHRFLVRLQIGGGVLYSDRLFRRKTAERMAERFKMFQGMTATVIDTKEGNNGKK